MFTTSVNWLLKLEILESHWYRSANACELKNLSGKKLIRAVVFQGRVDYSVGGLTESFSGLEIYLKNKRNIYTYDTNYREQRIRKSF